MIFKEKLKFKKALKPELSATYNVILLGVFTNAWAGLSGPLRYFISQIVIGLLATTHALEDFYKEAQQTEIEANNFL